MFQLSMDEMVNWKSQIVISNSEKMGLRKPPLVFTEQGVAMLSSILNSEKAIMVNIQIVRIFTKMRELLSTNKEILQKLEHLDRKDLENKTRKYCSSLNTSKQLEKGKQRESEQKNRTKIGYKS
jgi:hypothetical protein